MSITVQHAELFIHNIRTRIPFRYGIARMTAVPHLFVRVQCEINGRLQSGTAADSLIPKWFTKDPNTTYQQDLADMLRVIDAAARFLQEAGTYDTVFDLWQQVYNAQERWADGEGYPPLLWNFGVSLVERALIDAFCRATGQSFSQALRSNTLGIRLEALHPELAGRTVVELLPPQPLRQIYVRHTVGMADPLAEEDIQASDRTDDGLPQSLEASIKAYGLKYFKIKISGNLGDDIDRLKQIAHIFRRQGLTNYSLTLDGNEQFKFLEAFQEHWRSLLETADLQPLIDRLLFVEQPLHRESALSEKTCAALQRWTDRPPMIIDESDAQIDSLKVALDCGYAGTSHKNCKGIFKGIANACLLEHRCAIDPQGCFVLSGEDLANIGPVALLQDLAVMANLGIPHVERNGHHYFSGLSMFPSELQEEVLRQHADLYRPHAHGFTALNIGAGTISTQSVVEAPFGMHVDMDLSCCFTPRSAWSFEAFRQEYLNH